MRSFLLTLALLLGLAAPAPAGVGVNTAPQWSATVEGSDLPKMERTLTDLRPDTNRFGWANNAAARETLRFDQAAGIDSLVIDDPAKSPEQVVSEVAASGYRVVAIEGQNEPDAVGPYDPNHDRPLTDAEYAAVRDRQARLYAAVAGRVPVLCPASLYRVNDARLAGLACDIVSAHRYPDVYGAPPEPQDAALPVTPRPVWVTETGVLTYKKWVNYPYTWKWQVNETMQRDYLTRMVGMLRANGARRVMVYRLLNPCTDDFKPACGFGLYSYDGRPKLAAGALRG